MTRAHTIRRRAAALTAATAAAALASGCIKLDADLTLQGETASGTLLSAVDANALETAGIPPEEFLQEGEVFGSDPDEGLAQFDGVTAEEYDDGDWVGVRYHLDNAGFEAVNDFDEQNGGMRIDYDSDEGRYEFVADIDMMLEGLDEGFGPGAPGQGEPGEGEPGQGDLPPIDPEMLMQDMEMNVSITFPGEVIEHNGELSGTTVTWSVTGGERSEMRAVARDQPVGQEPGAGVGSSAGFGATGWLAVAALALAVLGAGAIVTAVVVASRRRSTTPPQTEEGPPVQPTA